MSPEAESKRRNGELLKALQKVADEHALTDKVTNRLMLAAVIDVRGVADDLAEKLSAHMADEDQVWLGVTTSLDKLAGLPDRVLGLEKTDRRWIATISAVGAVGSLAGGILMLILKAVHIL